MASVILSIASRQNGLQQRKVLLLSIQVFVLAKKTFLRSKQASRRSGCREEDRHTYVLTDHYKKKEREHSVVLGDPRFFTLAQGGGYFP